MPTQEDINAANVELQIANDNYAQLADRYNKYQELFQTYAKSSPEVQDRAADAMWRALEDFYQIEEKMRTAEDRINLAQSVVNNYNNIITQQPVQQTVARSNYNSGRNIPTVATPVSVVPETPITETPTTTGYQIQQYTPTQHNVSLRKAAEQPFTLPYENNTLSWIAGNFAAQSKNDWKEAGREWREEVWPSMKNFWNKFLNAEKRIFIDNPLKVANTTSKFVLWAPKRKL